MSAAIMGPAVSTFFNPQFSTPFSGEATPFVYLACLVAFLIVASGIVEMARELPSAGAFYTYVSRGLGPRAGFITGGLMFVAYALLPPAELGLIGSYLQSTLRTEADIDVPWWLIGMVPGGAMIVLAVEGIRASLQTALILFATEVGRRRAAGDHRGRARRPARTVAASAESGRFAPRLPGAGHRIRVRRAQLRRLRGRGDARRRGARAAPHGPARDPAQLGARRPDLRVLRVGRGQRARPGRDQPTQRRLDAVERPRRHLRVVAEVAGDRRVGLEHVRGDDQLGQRDRADPQHDGARGTAAEIARRRRSPAG